MITLQHVHYEMHDEVKKNAKVHNIFTKIFYFDDERLRDVQTKCHFVYFLLIYNCFFYEISGM